MIVHGIGITRQRELFVEGICAECESKVQVIEPLANMLRMSIRLHKEMAPDTDEPDYKPRGNKDNKDNKKFDKDFASV